MHGEECILERDVKLRPGQAVGDSNAQNMHNSKCRRKLGVHKECRRR